jgi:peptidoglycan hydrolase-like protein with peptidoglycan-binding domain
VAAKTKPDDLIGKLLKTSAATGEKPKETTKESAKAILATQHALMKLGFVIKPSGIFGPATRAAIEAFERDQHLPVKGEMSRKILKQLSAESGVAID